MKLGKARASLWVATDDLDLSAAELTNLRAAWGHWLNVRPSADELHGLRLPEGLPLKVEWGIPDKEKNLPNALTTVTLECGGILSTLNAPEIWMLCRAATSTKSHANCATNGKPAKRKVRARKKNEPRSLWLAPGGLPQPHLCGARAEATRIAFAVRTIGMVLLQRRADLVTQHPLTHAVDEHNPAKLLALGDVHHAVKMVHLDGEFRAVGQPALVVHQFVNVQVHLHVGISPAMLVACAFW